jgi:hypothetical protein
MASALGYLLLGMVTNGNINYWEFSVHQVRGRFEPEDDIVLGV